MGTDPVEMAGVSFIFGYLKPKEVIAMRKGMQKQFFKIIIAILLISRACYLHAQRENIRFRHLSIEHGLSQNSAFCMIQDNRGFMWIGTESGLNKYDGYGFTVYKYEVDNPKSISNHNIITMYIDRNNIFWIGTEKGLNRFDPGRELFTRFVHNPDDTTGLCDHRVLAICADPSEYLWIGTENGLDKFNPENKQFIHYRAEPGNPGGLSHNLINSLHLDTSGVLWIGTGGGGLNRFDREKKEFTCYKNIPGDTASLSDNNVICIYEDAAGALWIGTEGGGLNRFNSEKELFTCYKNITGDPASLSDNHVNVIYEDQSGVLWIGTENGGLNVFDRGKNAFVRYMLDPNDPNGLSINRVVSVCENVTGGLWFGTKGGGVNIFNRETQKFVHYKHEPNNPNSLKDNGIWAIYEDHNEILWIGTGFGGLNKFDRKKNKFTHFTHDPGDPGSISENSIYTIYEDKSGVFWIGTRSQGLNKFDPKTGRFSHYKHDPKNPYSISNNRVFCIFEDHLNDLWVGVINNAGGGLNKLDRKTGRFSLYNHDPDDPYSISNSKVMCIHEDPSNNLWIGTNGGGLNRFDREKERFFHYRSDSSDNKSLTGDFILSLYEDQSGTLWVGANNGLNKYNRDKETFTRYTTEDGLPDDVIYDIIEDDKGNLWMSTNNGLAKFNPKTEEFKNYDVNDGLQSNEFNTGTACKTKKGEMFFGGIGGFNSFYPDNIRDDPHVPSIVISEFRIFNKSVPIGKTGDGRTILEKSITETDEIVLSYRDNVFSFEFTALHYVAPDKNQYAYYMEGLEKEWNYVGTRRYVTYSGLPPGTYTFKVKGSNNDGVWNEDGTSLKITIVPPFWRTWWFYSLCVFSIVLMIAAILIYQVNRIKRQKEEEERLKVIADVGQVLEHGRATIYRRKINSDVYDYIGNGIRDITGYKAEEYSKAVWEKIVRKIELIGEYSDLTMEEALERMHDGRIDNFVMDFSVRTKSGEIQWVRDITTALRNESGECYAYFGILFDITDRKLVEQELAKKGKSIHRTLFEHTADPIMIFDKKTHKFLDCNKAVLRAYGYSKKEIRSMTPFDLHPPGDMEKVEKNIDLKNIDSPNEYKHVTKDGRQIDVEILSDETVYKGRPAWISIVRNITERKQAELKLTQLTEELSIKNIAMKNDLDMAREVQLAFLEKQAPRFPENVPAEKSSLQFSHRYIPATTLAGDFFNIIPISKDKVGILICDVMGHGARASLLTAYIQGLIGEIMPVASDPGAFMEKLNTGINSIMYQFEKGIFATVFYLVADIKTGQILYTNAGHPRPLLLRKSEGTVENLFANGNEAEPALGLLKDFFYSVFIGQVKEDDIILFYTDGVYEVDNKEGEIFGQERLLDSIQRHLSKQPDQLLDGILDDMNGFSKSEDFRDDVCMVAMHVNKL